MFYGLAYDQIAGVHVLWNLEVGSWMSCTFFVTSFLSVFVGVAGTVMGVAVGAGSVVLCTWSNVEVIVTAGCC